VYQNDTIPVPTVQEKSSISFTKSRLLMQFKEMGSVHCESHASSTLINLVWKVQICWYLMSKQVVQTVTAAL